MRILLLMPCDEQHVAMSNGIFHYLPPEVKQKTFAMPTYMDWLVHLKKISWTEALFDTLYAAKQVYNADKTADLIIIGNADKSLEFDAIFNMQELDESLPYKDDFMEKVASLEPVQADALLTAYLNVHQADESKMAMRDAPATADFLAAYLQTDIDKQALRDKYELDTTHKKFTPTFDKQVNEMKEDHQNAISDSKSK